MQAKSKKAIQLTDKKSVKPDRIQTQTDIRKDAMIAALEQSLGIVTTACKAVGLARATHYEWLDSDPEYKKRAEALADIALDFAESKLHTQIMNGDTTAIIFYLKTKGKKRGYIERSDINIQIEQPIFTGIDLKD